MSIEIRVLNMGIAATNCYIVGDTDARAALVIDPVDQAAHIAQVAQAEGWTIQMIVATHGHFDHVLASKELKALTGAPFLIHADAVSWLRQLPQTGIRFTGQPFPEAAEPDRLLTTTSETLTVGAITLETLYTPGHAPGHLALYMRDAGIVFSGDALFAGSIGRTDLPGGDMDVLMQSIATQLLTLPDETIVLPGHGGQTTIAAERQTNPFILAYRHD